jgi:hypothetical protein
VEEERLRLGDGRPGRRRLTPGRTAGEGSGEREDGDGRKLRSDGQQANSATLGLVPLFFLPNFDKFNQILLNFNRISSIF